MSKSVRINDMQNLFRGYRIKVHCLHCDAVYISNLLPTLKMPRRCKFCSSTVLEPIKYWEG